MTKSILALTLAFFSLLPILCVADGKHASTEMEAYEKGLDYLKSIAAHSEKYPDSAWANSLKTLAMSSSPEGDRYLANLAFFSLDGSAGEDYSCATSHRIATHGQSFLKFLRRARDRFDQENPCYSSQPDGATNFPAASCLSKQGFIHLVASYEAIEGKPEDNSELDCSYLFK
jgi:hypothetical protein